MIQNISASSIRKPIPAIVLFILLTFAGAIGFKKLGINQFPDVDIPYVTVTVTDPGAAPAELETQVTRIVENSVATVGDVVHITSNVQDGVSTTTVEFVFGKNIDRAVNDVRDAVTRVRSELPGSVERAGHHALDHLRRADAHLHGQKAPARAPAELSWFVDNEISKTLLTVPGVGQVKRVGGVDREVVITLRPDRLAVLRHHRGGDQPPAEEHQPGRARRQGAPSAAWSRASARSARRRASTPCAACRSRCKTAARCGFRTSARSRTAFADPTQDAYVNGERVVAFQVLRAVGSSSVDVARKVEKRDRAHLGRASRASRPSSSARPSNSRSSPTTPRSRRCGSARCSRWWWCSCSCATGAPR